MSSFLNIASVRPSTESEGPGNRFALWCQGCNKRCLGCCNPEMHSLEPRHIVSVDDLFNLIMDSKKENNIEGVSIIGGEPFLQAQGAAELAARCQERDLSVLVFTGYTLEELHALNDASIEALIAHTDLLVDGPFQEENIDDTRGWVGSSNQVVHFLSNKYSPGVEYTGEQSVEVLVNEESVFVNGWPSL